jgi:hypothetical protein
VDCGSRIDLSDAIIAWNIGGAGVVGGDAHAATLSCCDLYGNEGGDWVGNIAGQYDTEGNICLDPLFCDAGRRDFTLQNDSPCRSHPPENPECDRMGSWPVGCETSLVDSRPGSFSGEIRVTPNPCSGSCRISYQTAAPGVSAVEIFTATGRRIRSLRGGWSPAGNREITWDGRGEAGNQVGPGVYLIRTSGAAGPGSARLVVTR